MSYEYFRFIERILGLPGSEPLEVLESVKKFLIDQRPSNFEDCVKWARLLWKQQFNNQIQQLLFNFLPIRPSHEHRAAILV
jgi:ubiquitin-activating enzyme E1